MAEEGRKNDEDAPNMAKCSVALLCLFCFCCWCRASQ